MVGTGLSAASIDATVPLIDLGVDSLVAVLLRDWVQNELGVSLPVFKILGGDNAVDLVEHMVACLVPEAGKDAGQTSHTATSEDLANGKQNGHSVGPEKSSSGKQNGHAHAPNGLANGKLNGHAP